MSITLGIRHHVSVALLASQLKPSVANMEVSQVSPYVSIHTNDMIITLLSSGITHTDKLNK
jgi:hypothetical protein